MKGAMKVASKNGEAESSEVAARRAELVDAARELFEERGLDHTTVKDIAARVGVARSLFYHYFADKDEITEAVLDSYVEDFREMVENWNRSRTRGDVKGALHECVKMLRIGVFDKGSFRTDLARQQNAALYLRFSARTAEVLARYLTDTTAEDYARYHRVEIDHVYEMFYMLIIGLVGFVRSKPDTPDEVLEELVAQTLRLDLGGDGSS